MEELAADELDRLKGMKDLAMTGRDDRVGLNPAGRIEACRIRSYEDGRSMQEQPKKRDGCVGRRRNGKSDCQQAWPGLFWATHSLSGKTENGKEKQLARASRGRLCVSGEHRWDGKVERKVDSILDQGEIFKLANWKAPFRCKASCDCIQWTSTEKERIALHLLVTHLQTLVASLHKSMDV
jgi:hypothetical protein